METPPVLLAKNAFQKSSLDELDGFYDDFDSEEVAAIWGEIT